MDKPHQLCKNCIFADDPIDKKPCRDCIRAFLAARTHKPQTNADRVRAMSDEKLAERFAAACCRDYPCEDKYMMPDGMNCYGCWLDWLKKEVEE